MTRPVFFSVGGSHDAKFAAAVKGLLPDAMVYLYTRTGEEGVGFRPEIEREVQACRVFVVFWSDDYLKSEAAKLELAQARRLAETVDRQKRVLIVPISRKPPSLTTKWVNPIQSRDGTEYVLGEWRYDRALDAAPDIQKVAEFVRRKLEDAEVFGRQLVARPLVLDALKKTVISPDFSANEFVFVSGLEGDGRRTALRQFIKASYGNLTERPVPFDSAEGPEDLLARMMEAAGMTSRQRDDVLQRVEVSETSALKEIRKLIHQARSAKSYYVLALDRFSGADTVSVPAWVGDVFGKLQTGLAPLVFLVTSSPVTDALLIHYPNAKRVRIPGFDEHEMAELVHRLSSEDTKAAEWTVKRKEVVQAICGSSPSLCQTIMHCLRNEPNLEFIERIAHREEEKFSASMSAVLGHIIQRFKDKPNDVLALRIIERVGLTSKRALDEIIEPLLQEGSYDLYTMLEYGLLERLSDDILRIPPLIERRLGYILDNSEHIHQLDELFEQFSRRMVVAEDDYGAVYASNRAVAALAIDAPEDLKFARYLTTASLFKAGLERYIDHEFPRAHAILRRAMDKLTSQATIDLSAQIEIARYFGLAAARINASEDVSRACQFLVGGLANTPRAKQGEAMAAFLRGFEARQAGNYRDAIEEFERANRSLSDVRFAERQRGAIFTELSRAYLRRTPPDYESAVRFAQQAYDEKDVAHNLSGLIRARLHRTFGQRYVSMPNFNQEIGDIRQLVSELKLICTRTDRDFHLFREAELEVVVAMRQKKSMGATLDLHRSIGLIAQAMRLRPSARTLFYSWKLKVVDEKLDHSRELLLQCRQVLDGGNSVPEKDRADAAKIWALVRSRSNKRDALEVFKKHRNEMGAWSTAFINRIIPAQGVIAPDEVFLVLDRL